MTRGRTWTLSTLRPTIPLAPRLALTLAVLFLMLPLLRPSSVAADTSLPETLSAESPPEAIEEVSLEEVSFTEAAAEEWTLSRIVARLHPALVHVPIGWLLLLVLVDGATFVRRIDALRRWGIFLLGGTVASFVPAIASGLLSFQDYVEPPATALLHRNLIFGMAALCVAALVLRLHTRNDPKGLLRWLYLGLVAGAAALIAVAGHLGGKLVFGADHLPF